MINYPHTKKRKVRAVENETSNNSAFTLQTLQKKGMQLEELLNKTNLFYREKEVALIFKKPTPIKVVKTKSYKSNYQNKHVITEAYFEHKSTTDYSGIYQEKYIDFEAKQTKYKSFNLKANLHLHQIEHLIAVEKMGGFSFLIINFYTVDKFYIIRFKYLLDYVDSENFLIPLSFFHENAHQLYLNINPALDYLPYVQQEISKEK